MAGLALGKWALPKGLLLRVTKFSAVSGAANYWGSFLMRVARNIGLIFLLTLGACQSAEQRPAPAPAAAEGPARQLFELLNGRSIYVRQHYLVASKYADQTWRLNVIDAETYHVLADQNGEWVHPLDGKFNQSQPTEIPNARSFVETIGVKGNVVTDTKKYDEGVAIFTVTVFADHCQVYTPQPTNSGLLLTREACELR